MTYAEPMSFSLHELPSCPGIEHRSPTPTPRFFAFLLPHMPHRDVPGQGLNQSDSTVTAMLDLSSIGELCHSLWQCQILNPLSEARDQSCILSHYVRLLTH